MLMDDIEKSMSVREGIIQLVVCIATRLATFNVPEKK
jgi:hypothetical protein